MIERCDCGEITLFTITNARGGAVRLSTLGAGVLSAVVPDADGNMSDVVLGYADPRDYMADGPCAGKIPGRFANRIGAARFSIDGREYRLNRNDGENSLHGGPSGFQNRIWRCVAAEGDSVEMEYVSADGEEGYPGELTARVSYTWTDSCELIIRISAMTDRPTAVNLTNHAYFNLAGHGSGSVLDHRLRVFGDRFVVTDAAFIPTGEIAPVAGTALDFTASRSFRDGMKPDGSVLLSPKGYNHCWVLEDGNGYVPLPAGTEGPLSGRLRMAARLTAPDGSRTLEVATTYPGIQIYTGGWLDGAPAGKEGAVYGDYSGVALECQQFPDAPNHPSFPSALLRPGQLYSHLIIFRFTVD